MKARSNVQRRPSEVPAPRTGGKRRETALSDRQGTRGVMNGWAASPGTAIGRAALVIDSDDIVRVQRGAIIISKAASPELAIVISKVRAIATEYGGQGAVASGLAREYGIPAVVGVKGLTEVIRDGDLVRVNGTKGTVEIVELTV